MFQRRLLNHKIMQIISLLMQIRRRINKERVHVLLKTRINVKTK